MGGAFAGCHSLFELRQWRSCGSFLRPICRVHGDVQATPSRVSDSPVTGEVVIVCVMAVCVKFAVTFLLEFIVRNPGEPPVKEPLKPVAGTRRWALP